MLPSARGDPLGLKGGGSGLLVVVIARRGRLRPSNRAGQRRDLLLKVTWAIPMPRWDLAGADSRGCGNRCVPLRLSREGSIQLLGWTSALGLYDFVDPPVGGHRR